MLMERTLDNITGRISTTEIQYKIAVSTQIVSEDGEMEIMKALIPGRIGTKEIQIIGSLIIITNKITKVVHRVPKVIKIKIILNIINTILTTFNLKKLANLLLK